MAAPATTARVDPTGIKLDDGYSSVIAFARDPNVNLWEKDVKPPGIDGGDEIDTTTMHNDDWRTSAPRSLKTLTEATFTAAYDPLVYTQILELINQRGAVTNHFPDGSTLDYYGYLKAFEPDDLVEGEQPTATVTVTPTNYDPGNGVEAAPVMTEVSGT